MKRRIIDRSKTRVLAMLNSVGTGMMNNKVEQNPVDMEPEKTAAFAKQHPDMIVGIKSAHWRQPTFIAVERAVQAGKLTNLPVMVDFGSFLPERLYQQMVLELLAGGFKYLFLPGTCAAVGRERKDAPLSGNSSKAG